MVTRKTMLEVIGKYKKAWINRDPDAILEIFTNDAVYKERSFARPFVGHAGIRRYWTDKVVGEQEKIRFRLLNLFIDGDNVLAEWEVKFYDKKRKVNIHLREAEVFEMKGNKIARVREYWHSKHSRPRSAT
jgi:ketosteroid isomerase-like protein